MMAVTLKWWRLGFVIVTRGVWGLDMEEEDIRLQR
jgi:hypothetical protein